MGFKPEVVAFWMDGGPVDPDNPLAAVKYRARDLVAAAEVLELAARTADVDMKAGVIDQAAELFCSPGFDPAATYDACEAAGMSDGQADSAAYIAVTLGEIEQLSG